MRSIPLLILALLYPSFAAAKDRVLWDHWYTVTLGKSKTPYEYYNDRVEIRKGRIVFQNKAWKKEEDYINEEQLGAFAEDNDELTPLFFNFHSSYRSSETIIDGTVTNKVLNVRIRKGSRELQPIKRSIQRKLIFSQHFPVWLGKHLSQFKPGAPHSFVTILEDNIDNAFASVSGLLRMEKPDDLAIKLQATRLSVTFQDQPSTWWVDEMGSPYRIEIPKTQTIVERSTEKAAKAFLGKNEH